MSLSRLIVRPGVAWSVVVISLLISVAGAVFSTQVEQDDDLLAFLPEGNEDVAAFREINERFGGLDVALVGVQADPLDPMVFDRLKIATRALNDAPQVEFALSLANVDDFVPAEGGGIQSDFLVKAIPEDPAAQDALRKYVASKDLVVGQLISKDQQSLMILCFAAHGEDPRSFAASVEQNVKASFQQERIYWGGAPFISTYIYTTTQDDLRQLTPWAVLAVVLLVFLAFRDFIGAGLALVSTGMGIAVSMGLMGALGVHYNIVLSSMPVILFSVGSAYGIHVLARYYPTARTMAPKEAVVATLDAVGPTVVTAGLTTVGGLLSFLVMDIEPMRTFGLFTAIGIFATLFFSLTFVPAVIVVLNLGPRRVGDAGRVSDALIPMVQLAQQRRGVMAASLLAVAALGGWYASRVDTRMDQSAFFAPDSEPARADRFFLQNFGGSQFIQVHFKGDFTDPHVLRELTRFSDEVAEHPKVAGVQHIGQVLSMTNAAMEGARRVPDDAAKTKLLYTFLAGRAAVDQLVTRDHKEAVVHVKIGTSDITDVEALLVDVEKLAERSVVSAYRVVPGPTAAGQARLLAYAVGRVRALARQSGHRLDGVQAASVRAALLDLGLKPNPEPVQRGLEAFLVSEESIVDLSSVPGVPMALAAAVAQAGPEAGQAQLSAAVQTALSGLEQIDGEPVQDLQEDLLMSLETPLDELWRGATADARTHAALKAAQVRADSPELFERISNELETLAAPTALVADSAAATGRLSARVNGLPVLHRGLSQSATDNQIASLVIALSLVVVLLSVAFRSPRLGLIAASPTVITLLLVYGGMGGLGVHLDIGTSMLASIIIGAGVDYAVHFVAAWREHEGPDAAVAAAQITGPAIWTNALMVAAGFFLLTLGEARTLQNVGGLTAAAMLTAAIATFLAVPVLMARAAQPQGESAPATISKDNLQEG